MTSEGPATRSGRFPLSVVVLLGLAGALLVVPVVAVLVTLDPLASLAPILYGPGLLALLLAGLLIWVGVRRVRGTFGWARGPSVLLAVGVVAGVLTLLLVARAVRLLG